MKTKKIIVLISLTVFTHFITGCTAKSWYEGGKTSAKYKCNKAPLTEREECLKNINNKTYEEYEKKK